MLLSVVVPVYNAEKTIEKCLLSIINQEFDDFEIVVVNDGSTDKTPQIIASLIDRFPNRIIRLINQKNKGNSIARKTGIENSKGAYVGFVDADDWIEPQMYRKMMEQAIAKGADVVSCDAFFEYPICIEKRIQKSDVKIVSGKKALFLLHEKKAVYDYCWNKIIKREKFKGVFFATKNIVGEDYTIIRQILLASKKVVILNYLGYHYILSKGSISNSGFTASQRNGFINHYLILKKTYETRDSELIRSTDVYMINQFLWTIIWMYGSRSYDYKIIKWIRKYIRPRIKYIIMNDSTTLLYKFSSIWILFDYRILGCMFMVYNRLIHGL